MTQLKKTSQCIILILCIILTGCTNLPLLQLSENNLNKGIVRSNQEFQVTIPIKNSGGGKLHIYNIIGDCECINFTLNNKNIIAGDSSLLKIKIKAPQTFKDTITHSNTLIIYSNSIDKKIKEITINYLVTNQQDQ